MWLSICHCRLRKCLALLIPQADPPPLFGSMNPPGPSATDIQSHLYNSFIHASTYDVAIRVSGRTWRAIYKLHRVVLIQSVRSCSYLPGRNLPNHSCQGFFRSLFTAGFSESQAARRGGTDEISVTFDDCNITRPGVGFAFFLYRSNVCYFQLSSEIHIKFGP